MDAVITVEKIKELSGIEEKVTTLESSKQDTLVPGDGITIEGNVISSTGGGSQTTQYIPGEHINFTTTPEGKTAINAELSADENTYHSPEYTTGLKIATSNETSKAGDIYAPIATTTNHGVVKVARARTSSYSYSTGSTTSGRYYGVEVDKNGTAFVNVPWTSGSVSDYIHNSLSSPSPNMKYKLTLTESSYASYLYYDENSYIENGNLYIKGNKMSAVAPVGSRDALTGLKIDGQQYNIGGGGGIIDASDYPTIRAAIEDKQDFNSLYKKGSDLYYGNGVFEGKTLYAHTIKISFDDYKYILFSIINDRQTQYTTMSEIKTELMKILQPELDGNATYLSCGIKKEMYGQLTRGQIGYTSTGYLQINYMDSNGMFYSLDWPESTLTVSQDKVIENPYIVNLTDAWDVTPEEKPFSIIVSKEAADSLSAGSVTRESVESALTTTYGNDGCEYYTNYIGTEYYTLYFHYGIVDLCKLDSPTNGLGNQITCLNSFKVNSANYIKYKQIYMGMSLVSIVVSYTDKISQAGSLNSFENYMTDKTVYGVVGQMKDPMMSMSTSEIGVFIADDSSSSIKLYTNIGYRQGTYSYNIENTQSANAVTYNGGKTLVSFDVYKISATKVE